MRSSCSPISGSTRCRVYNLLALRVLFILHVHLHLPERTGAHPNRSALLPNSDNALPLRISRVRALLEATHVYSDASIW